MILDLVAAGKQGGRHRQQPQGHRQPARRGRAAAANRQRRARRRPDRPEARRRGRAHLRAAPCATRTTTACARRSTAARSMSSAARPGCGPREEFAGSVDVLFIDEAGQFSLANALAVSPAAAVAGPARRPAAARPADSRDASAGRRAERARAILGRCGGRCRRTRACSWSGPGGCTRRSASSPRRSFYAAAAAAAGRQRAAGPAGRRLADGVGHPLRRRRARGQPERHRLGRGGGGGRAMSSHDLLDGASVDRPRRVSERSIGPSDILVVTPYNAQRKRIDGSSRGAAGLRGGRGRAPWTSSRARRRPSPSTRWPARAPEDAPRGMEFLYSLNRLNVATSRAHCLTVVVASPGARPRPLPHAAPDAARQRPLPPGGGGAVERGLAWYGARVSRRSIHPVPVEVTSRREHRMQRQPQQRSNRSQRYVTWTERDLREFLLRLAAPGAD